MRSPLVSFKARNVQANFKEGKTLHNPPINSAYFKWVLTQVGGFGETSNYGEDLELDAKINEKGYELYYLSKIMVYHQHKSNIKEFLRQMYEFGKGRVRVGRKYKKFFQLYHYAPAFLCLFTFSPLFLVPMVLCMTNAFLIVLERKELNLLPGAIAFTLFFYIAYGLGEIIEICRNLKKDK
jgi:cellulose synthase/poly-beta-1,6-N-acetylglucosamine synthase-like glycosyltransferase